MEGLNDWQENCVCSAIQRLKRNSFDTKNLKCDYFKLQFRIKKHPCSCICNYVVDQDQNCQAVQFHRCTCTINKYQKKQCLSDSHSCCCEKSDYCLSTIHSCVCQKRQNCKCSDHHCICDNRNDCRSRKHLCVCDNLLAQCKKHFCLKIYTEKSECIICVQEKQLFKKIQCGVSGCIINKEKPEYCDDCIKAFKKKCVICKQ